MKKALRVASKISIVMIIIIIAIHMFTDIKVPFIFFAATFITGVVTSTKVLSLKDSD